MSSAVTWDGSPADQLRRRHRAAEIFRWVCWSMCFVGLVLLVVLLWSVFADGASHLDPDFLTSFPSRFAEKAGIKAALWGTLWVISLTALFAVPVGTAAAIYLEEYAPSNRVTEFIDVNIANLAGVPSIVYGILGLALFVRALDLERSVIAGALTLALLILPVIIIAGREAIRAVPSSVRQAAFAVGATRWQTVRHHVLPSAFPGIITGVILALSRAIGETAPLIMLGALTYVPFVPTGLKSAFTVMPIQIFNWAARPQAEFHEVAAAGIIVLLVVLLSMNAVAVLIRHRAERSQRW